MHKAKGRDARTRYSREIDVVRKLTTLYLTRGGGTSQSLGAREKGDLDGMVRLILIFDSDEQCSVNVLGDMSRLAACQVQDARVVLLTCFAPVARCSPRNCAAGIWNRLLVAC